MRLFAALVVLGLAAGAQAETPLPFPVEITAEFALVDQDGETVSTEGRDRPMAVFFGYANCEAICSVAMPSLGAALDVLGDDAERLDAFLITVDPERDTPEVMASKLPQWHPKLRGLTGSEDALAAARTSFQIERKLVFTDPEGNPVYAHGSFIYLIGRDGKVATLLPPILSPERMAELIRQYL
ncbi:MAG: SCO family protein [Pseudomonadota bacterium]